MEHSELHRGYIEAVWEIEQQLQNMSFKSGFDDVVVACGSGGTATGQHQGGVCSRDMVDIQDVKGIDYAMNMADELKFVKEIAEVTGVILDPVYSGKAAYAMMKDMAKNPKKWEGRKIVFIHTGGLLGLFNKTDQMMPLMGSWRKMDINESVPCTDGIGKMF